jgi:hypothetical protein
MDYSNLIAELRNASTGSDTHVVSQKLRALSTYLLKLQETGNYIIAEKAMEEWKNQWKN